MNSTVRADLLRESFWLLGMLLAIAGIVFVLRQASRPVPNLSSGFDGLDPVETQCASKGGQDVQSAGSAAIRDSDGAVVGHVFLATSLFCDTRWPRYTLLKSALPELKGRTLVITTIRRGDHRVIVYPRTLSGLHTDGWGSMLAANGSCVQAVVQLQASGSHGAGPAARTGCG